MTCLEMAHADLVAADTGANLLVMTSQRFAGHLGGADQSARHGA